MAELPNLPFVQVELDLLAFAAKNKLNATDLRVYMAMCHFSYDFYGKNYIIDVGYDAISKKAHAPRRNVIRSCLRMEDLGMLTKRGHNKAGCVMWELVWQSPAGRKARHEAAMKAGLDQVSECSPTPENGGVANRPPPSDAGVADRPPTESPIDHQQSRQSATLLSTSEVENKKPLTTTSQGGNPDPDPNPDADESLRNLEPKNRTILSYKQKVGVKSISDLIEGSARRQRQLLKDGASYEDLIAMQTHRHEQSVEKEEIDRMADKHANGTVHANGTTPAPSAVDDDEVPVELASNKQMAIREEVRSLVEDKKMPPPLRTAIRGDDDGDGSGS